MGRITDRLFLAALALSVGTASAQAPTPAPTAPLTQIATVEPLNLDAAVRYALVNNPALAAFRLNRGIAEGAVVVSKTYPFNPLYQGTLLRASGGDPGSVTNSYVRIHLVGIDVQIMHQQRYRQQAAYALLKRTDWEISAQELLAAVTAIRSFDTVVYRQGKVALAEEFLRINQKSAERVKQLVDLGNLKASDLLVARAEINDVQSQLALNRVAVFTAQRDYLRALGLTTERVEVSGSLDRVLPAGDEELWQKAALELRPDRQARISAIDEAAAAVRLQVADRFGNPQIAMVQEYNETKNSFIGARLQVPLAVFNRRQGEIMQAEARLTQAHLLVRQVDVEIKQDVAVAAARVAETRKLAENYRYEILPALTKNLEEINLLFQQGQQGIDILKVLDIRRRLLRAQDGYLDARLAHTSALADLALAVGDPGLAMGVNATPPVEKK